MRGPRAGAMPGQDAPVGAEGTGAINQPGVTIMRQNMGHRTASPAPGGTRTLARRVAQAGGGSGIGIAPAPARRTAQHVHGLTAVVWLFFELSTDCL